MVPVIETESLSRFFGPIRAVDGLTFQVYEGEVFGLLGPNGAGKTTTVRLLNGVLRPSGGQARVLGLDPAREGGRLRQQTGVLTETLSLYERLTARENLALFGALYGIPEMELARRVARMLEEFGLADRADGRVGEFSKGMKQRLALARALLHEPPLLFLDEPTAGLDPEAARQVTEMIGQLSRREGRTVFLCTHNLTEAQRLCDRVAVMDRGRLLALGTLEELSRTLWPGLPVEIGLGAPLTDAAVGALRRLPGVRDVQHEDLWLTVSVTDENMVPAVVETLVREGARILHVVPRQPSLEEIYFAIRGDQAS
jgi:ABC-2 type transport system ATP-binding protein